MRIIHGVYSYLVKQRKIWSDIWGCVLYTGAYYTRANTVVVVFGVVGLRRVDEEQSGPPEKALCLGWIMKRLLKPRTWSCLIGRKFDSLKRGEVVQVVVFLGLLASEESTKNRPDLRKRVARSFRPYLNIIKEMDLIPGKL